LTYSYPNVQMKDVICALEGPGRNVRGKYELNWRRNANPVSRAVNLRWALGFSWGPIPISRMDHVSVLEIRVKHKRKF